MNNQALLFIIGYQFAKGIDAQAPRLRDSFDRPHKLIISSIETLKNSAMAMS